MEIRRDGPAGAGNDFMVQALEQARRGAVAGEVPVGALIVHGPSRRILARAHNEVEARADPTAHAELLAIRRAAAAMGAPRLTECDLYVTLEPCPMCAQAIAFARLRRLYYGADDPKGGGVDNGPRIFAQPSCHHKPEIYGGIAGNEAAAILRQFIDRKSTRPNSRH